MRILNISAQKPDSTGSGIYLAQTVGCMERLGHAAAVVCGVDATDNPQGSLPAGTPVWPVRFNTPELPFPVCGMSDVMPYEATRYRDLTPVMAEQFKAAFRQTIARAVAEFAPDLLVVHHLYVVMAVAVSVAEEAELPVVAVSHGTDVRQMTNHGLEREYIVAQARKVRRAFALQEANAADLLRVYGLPESKVAVAGIGYDPGIFRLPGAEGPGATAESSEAEEASVTVDLQARGPRPLDVLFVGKIARLKGVESLMDALDAAAGKGRRVRALLVGGHSDETEYAEVTRRIAACRADVEQWGPVSPMRVARLYQQADVFVLPSFFEGLPLVVAEALACGCKVVVTDLPGIRAFYDAFVPDAPVWYVEPPAMRALGEPEPGELPAFGERLARALEQAMDAPWHPCGIDALNWESLTKRLLEE